MWWRWGSSASSALFFLLIQSVDGSSGSVDGALHLWITHLRRCGLRCFAPVDYARGTRCGFAATPLVDELRSWRAKRTHAVLYMLRGCVGFSWAKPSVTKSSTHLLVFLVLTTHAVLYMLCKSTSQHPRGRRPSRRGAVVRLA